MNKLKLPVGIGMFFDNFVTALSTYKDKFNIPFITSSLYQELSKPSHDIEEFISDMQSYKVDMDIEDTNDDYEPVVVKLYLYNKQNKLEDYYYTMSFILDPRYYNYCQCTPDMDGYREDKDCCGYDCDATFCTCQIDMVKSLCFHKWDGCEHDYWEYEDSFYKTYPYLKDSNKKQKLIANIQNMQREIELAKEQLEEYQRQLRDLETGIKEECDGFDETLECGVYNC